MLSHLAAKAARPTAMAAFRPQARFITATTKAAATPIQQGSKGRQMPAAYNRATTPATGVEATLTIRVCWSQPIIETPLN